MRIAQVSPLYESVPPRQYGGTELVVHDLTEELVARGHDVTLFASGDSRTSARLVPMCRRALRADVGCTDHLAHHVRMIHEVYLRAAEFDLIHFHIDYLHFPTSEQLPVPHLTTLHGRLDIPDLVPLYRSFARVPLVSISRAQRGPLAFANWIGTVHHGLPLDRYRFSQRGAGYLAFLGRISPEKGLDRAIEIARRAGRPIRVAAKVDEEERAYLETKVEPLLREPFVEFLGEANERQKRALLCHADALLFPIDWPEPFGLVMIEAMACGTPVIAFPCGSVPEIIEDGQNGFVVSNVRAAAAAVGKLPTLSRARCREVFVERFSAERMADDYLALYGELLQRPELTMIQ